MPFMPRVGRAVLGVLRYHSNGKAWGAYVPGHGLSSNGRNRSPKPVYKTPHGRVKFIRQPPKAGRYHGPGNLEKRSYVYTSKRSYEKTNKHQLRPPSPLSPGGGGGPSPQIRFGIDLAYVIDW